MKFVSVIVLVLMATGAFGAGFQSLACSMPAGAAELAYLLRNLHKPTLQHLNQITPANARNLEIKWVFQADSVQKMEVTPLVVNGIMYVTQATERHYRPWTQKQVAFSGFFITPQRRTPICAADL